MKTKLLICIIAILFTGCSWKSYNRSTYEADVDGVWLKERIGVGLLSWAMFSQADHIEVQTPDGKTLYIGKYEIDEDSLYFEVDPLTKKIRIITEKGE